MAAVGEGGLLGLAVDPNFERNSRLPLPHDRVGNEVLRYEFEGDRLRRRPRARRPGGRGDPRRRADPLRAGRAALRLDGRGRRPVAGPEPRLAERQDPAPARLRGGAGQPEIVSSGHRNVQGLDWEPGSGRLYATEFGPDSDDEVNLIRKGGNYGWPERRATRAAPSSSAGGELRGRDRALRRHLRPQARIGVDRRLLFAALRGEQLRRVKLDGGDRDGERGLFEGDFGRLRTVVEGPDGALYLLTNNTDGRGSPREGDDRVRLIPPPGR